jgi:predicted DNA binding CopG/RHH family protein
MKRIIDGITYDTETATEVVSGDYGEFSDTYWGLFQTRHGAFFKVVRDAGEDRTDFFPLSDQKAQKLVEKHANHLVEQYFGPMPEYGSAEKRITLRIPIGLAKRVENAAAAKALDVNKYIQRSLEKAVASDGQPPNVI